MKKVIFTICGLLIFTFASVSADGVGSGFGSLQTATTSGMGNGHFMGILGLADATSFGGIFNYGLSKNTDGRIKLGLIDYGGRSDTKIMFGVDFKYNFISMDELQNGPFDMALGGFFEYYDFSGGSVWTLGGQYIGSYPIKSRNNSGSATSSRVIFTPYGRLNVRVESQNNDFTNNSTSNLEVGFNGGVKWNATPDIDMYGELQLDGNDGFMFGIDFSVL